MHLTLIFLPSPPPLPLLPLALFLLCLSRRPHSLPTPLPCSVTGAPQLLWWVTERASWMSPPWQVAAAQISSADVCMKILSNGAPLTAKSWSSLLNRWPLYLSLCSSACCFVLIESHALSCCWKPLTTSSLSGWPCNHKPKKHFVWLQPNVSFSAHSVPLSCT